MILFPKTQHNCFMIFILVTIFEKRSSPDANKNRTMNNESTLFPAKKRHTKCPILHQFLFKIFDLAKHEFSGTVLKFFVNFLITTL